MEQASLSITLALAYSDHDVYMYTCVCVCVCAGQFGEVFKAVYIPSSGGQSITVAVKTSKTKCTEEQKASFLKEMAVMSTLMHPNLVRLYGMVSKGESSVMENCITFFSIGYNNVT